MTPKCVSHKHRVWLLMTDNHLYLILLLHSLILSLKTQPEGPLPAHSDAPTASFPRLGQISLVSPGQFTHKAIRNSILFLYFIFWPPPLYQKLFTGVDSQITWGLGVPTHCSVEHLQITYSRPSVSLVLPHLQFHIHGFKQTQSVVLYYLLFFLICI